MRRLLSIVFLQFIVQSAFGQITITSSDMPASGDTLRYSIASPIGSTFSPADSGASHSWAYTFTPVAQAVDTYRTATDVSVLYFLISGSAYGYKVADSFPGVGTLLPGTTIKKLYTFFDNSSTKFQAQAFAAVIDGIPSPFNYTTPDVWFRFPLNYTNTDSTNYKLNITVPSLGGIKEVGYRKTRVDGWGTITTPYYTTPVNCIRVRSEIHEIDSISITGLFSFGLPRNTVEYKWLVNGQHYPALWITTNVTGGTETVSSVRYKDAYRSFDTASINQVPTVNNSVQMLKAYPNPIINSIVTIDVPASWKEYKVEVYDMQMKLVLTAANTSSLDLSALPSGQYVGHIACGDKVGFVMLTK